MQVLEILELILFSVFRVLLNQLFWIVVLLVGLQYYRIAKNRAELFGVAPEPIWRPTLYATGYGLLGGIFGSILMVAIGISLSGIGVGTLWLVAIVLMLLGPRFICFAYAGGLISLSSLLIGYPKVDVPELMGLVAILHMVESLLILLSGHLGAVPVFTKDKTGRVVGGFTLQKLWPIPIVVLFALSTSITSRSSGIDMPDWWPLINSGLTDPDTNIMYALVPVVAGLGYGDLALARKPEEKSKISALNLGVYSVVLLLLAILAAKFYPFAFLAALFAPLGHEWVISLGQKVEYQGKPLYVPPARGVMLLDVNPSSAAGRMGLRSGDILLDINGYPVNNKYQLDFALEYAYGPVEIEYLQDGKKLVRDVASVNYRDDFGIIPVPEGNEEYYVELRGSGLLVGLIKKIFRKK